MVLSNIDQRQLHFGLFTYSPFVLEHYWRHLHPSVKCTWAVNNAFVQKDLQSKGMQNIILRDSLLGPSYPLLLRKISRIIFRSLKKDAYFGQRLIDEVKPDLWLSDATLQLIKYDTGVPKIQVFHSVPIKQYYFFPENLEYDLILLPGHYHHQEFIKRFPEAKSKNFKVVGWPRHDDLVTGRFKKEDILSSLGLDPNKPTILYAPTYNAYPIGKLFPSLLGEDIDILTQLGEFVVKNNCNFIIKIHPQDALVIRNKNLFSIAEEYGICYIPKEVKGFIEDPNMHLVAADILISDISGVVTDYLALDKPIIFFDPDNEAVWKNSDIPRDWRPGFIANSLFELFNQIETSLAKPDQFSSRRRELTEKLFLACDGHSGQRAAETVLDFANQHLNKK